MNSILYPKASFSIYSFNSTTVVATALRQGSHAADSPYNCFEKHTFG